MIFGNIYKSNQADVHKLQKNTDILMLFHLDIARPRFQGYHNVQKSVRLYDNTISCSSKMDFLVFRPLRIHLCGLESKMKYSSDIQPSNININYLFTLFSNVSTLIIFLKILI